MGSTSIQWTDHSINPFRARDKISGKVGHFCTKISPGCANCYSSRLQSRFGLHEFVASNRSKVELFLDESKLQDVIGRKKPTKYFWCDMTDMFLDDYPFEWIDKCFATMALTPQHTHQVLTKRPARMHDYLEKGFRAEWSFWMGHLVDKSRMEYVGRAFDLQADIAVGSNFPMKNVWLGVSCEDQKTADERIPKLLQTPAAVRFVSYEPALEAVDFTHIKCVGAGYMNALTGRYDGTDACGDGIDWLIFGGESGPNARDCNIHWARNTRDECKEANVACFIKQIGRNPYDGMLSLRLKDSHGGDMNEWDPDLRIREFPR